MRMPTERARSGSDEARQRNIRKEIEMGSKIAPCPPPGPDGGWVNAQVVRADGGFA
jgi:hypothetical protein